MYGSNSNIVNNNVKQKHLFNINSDDLVAYDVPLESLKKQGKAWKPHHRNLATWALVECCHVGTYNYHYIHTHHKLLKSP
jgi:hypothetical protein